MEYKVYKMSFQTAVHFGNGQLESGECTFCADTLFSALCQEAYKIDKETLEKLYEYASKGNIKFSDAFPYIGETYYLPKPMMKIDKEQEVSSSVIKKAYKKLKYIPLDSFGKYLQGEYDVLADEGIDSLGKHNVKAAVAIRGKEKTEPYRVGEYYFNHGNGLYFILGYENEEMFMLVQELLESLMYSGIGGKRAAGYGRFELNVTKVPDELKKRMTSEGEKYMTLSVALPKEEELKSAMEGAQYTLNKRSGFVASENYADTQMRKRDLYVFKAGACFLKKFEGDVYDVSGKAGKHAVYRYAVPLFMEVDS